ncbi:MAG TPA: hypothetical protein VK163_00290 [Opitutaceae bacterium]|nr:hypothetical protein [Opitutaceae bacterium]
MRHVLLLLLASLTTLSARADALADFRTALQNLAGTEPVTGTLEFVFSDSSGDQKKPNTQEGRASATVSLGAEGLRIAWAPEQLASAVREANDASGKPKQPAPTRDAMSRLNAIEIYDYLEAGGELSRRLASAKLLGEKQETWNGQAARVLTFKLEPPLSDEDRKVIKEIDGSARLWIADDGTPLAAESSLRLKGRALVVIGFEHSQKEQFTFARLGDRLVVTSHQRETADDGGGQHTRSKINVTLRPAQS